MAYAYLTEGSTLYPSYLSYGVIYNRGLVSGPYSPLRGAEGIGGGGGDGGGSALGVGKKRRERISALSSTYVTYVPSGRLNGGRSGGTEGA